MFVYVWRRLRSLAGRGLRHFSGNCGPVRISSRFYAAVLGSSTSDGSHDVLAQQAVNGQAVNAKSPPTGELSFLRTCEIAQ
jgi:hypothetical protein